jgi:hypothetical protein
VQSLDGVCRSADESVSAVKTDVSDDGGADANLGQGARIVDLQFDGGEALRPGQE